MRETPEHRSRTMRAVKSRNTSPELAVRRLLHSMGYRYRLHRADLPGKPDIVFPGRRKAIFVHGCFWHGHNCPRGARIPKENRAYWQEKIDRNRSRDKKVSTQIRLANWKRLIIWECEIRSDDLSEKLRQFLDRD
ncbi:DNA mismatch endonuclease Vsr [Terriglobus albidus]|uniref:Very short patch repair endonuclease n=1 Tax=Terriglobus albidus TaxID=1592106 RepID=A0A5B9E4Q9_9BACT|nr:very short patch repair endonuclease [Terriglobus albidus]QEE26769.1 DNA mismatch endonuclease Vsr [Terriglobus albidus]